MKKNNIIFPEIIGLEEIGDSKPVKQRQELDDKVVETTADFSGFILHGLDESTPKYNEDTTELNTKKIEESRKKLLEIHPKIYEKYNIYLKKYPNNINEINQFIDNILTIITAELSSNSKNRIVGDIFKFFDGKNYSGYVNYTNDLLFIQGNRENRQGFPNYVGKALVNIKYLFEKLFPEIVEEIRLFEKELESFHNIWSDAGGGKAR
ncbi:MAG: hypothetical protein PHV23_02750 [Candidatus Gracilibacteria bacterium]|nr:hypothetical protein [Candidatus Gracilibacteria bacterium]